MRQQIALFAVLAAAACGSPGADGAAGPTGLPGPEGASGANGMNGTNGNNASTIVISERARQGLLISPSALDLTGLSTDQVEKLGMGSYLVNAIGGCSDCHDSPGTGKFLAGGTSFALDSSGHVVVARNLTPDAQTGLKLTEAEFIEAIRTGKDFTNTGQNLIVMPWPIYRWMSTADLKAIYAYLKAIPAVSNMTTADNKPTIAPVAFPTTYGDGEVPRTLPAETDQSGAAIPDPDYVRRGMAVQPLDDKTIAFDTFSAQEQIAYGRGSYLVNAVAGCNDCHTNPDRKTGSLQINTDAYLAGGRVFNVPPPLVTLTHQKRSMSADLIGMTNGFINSVSYATFAAIIQTGTHADDTPAAPLAFPMPYTRYRKMVNDDLGAIYTYLRHLPKRTGANDKATQDPTVSCAVDGDCATGETCDPTAKECIGKTCAMDSECSVCQTCTANKCAAPASASTCLTQGI